MVLSRPCVGCRHGLVSLAHCGHSSSVVASEWYMHLSVGEMLCSRPGVGSFHGLVSAVFTALCRLLSRPCVGGCHSLVSVSCSHGFTPSPAGVFASEFPALSKIQEICTLLVTALCRFEHTYIVSKVSSSLVIPVHPCEMKRRGSRRCCEFATRFRHLLITLRVRASLWNWIVLE